MNCRPAQLIATRFEGGFCDQGVAAAPLSLVHLCPMNRVWQFDAYYFIPAKTAEGLGAP